MALRLGLVNNSAFPLLESGVVEYTGHSPQGCGVSSRSDPDSLFRIMALLCGAEEFEQCPQEYRYLPGGGGLPLTPAEKEAGRSL